MKQKTREISVNILTAVVIIFAVVMFGVILDHCTNGLRATPEEMAKSSYVGIYQGDRWIGSGVIFKKIHEPFEASYIITASHLKAKEDTHTVGIVTAHNSRKGASAYYQFRILYQPPEDMILTADNYTEDLVIMVVQEDIGTARPLGHEPEINDTVYSVAGYRGTIPTVEKGRVTLIEDGMIRHTARSGPGHSGSAIFDSNGFVVGMLESIWQDVAPGFFGGTPQFNREICFAISVEAIKQKLKDNGLQYLVD